MNRIVRQLVAVCLPIAFVGCDSPPAPGKGSADGSEAGGQADKIHVETHLRVCAVGMAYADAAKGLGRSPTTLAELEPFLKYKECLVSARDGKPFEMRAVDHVDVGGAGDRLIVWESTADGNGERYVFQESQGGDRVGREEFNALRDGAWTRERWLPRKKLYPQGQK